MESLLGFEEPQTILSALKELQTQRTVLTVSVQTLLCVLMNILPSYKGC